MPKTNDLKVICCYSSKKRKDIVESFLKDQAEVFQQTLSVRREKILLDYILPEEPNAQYWVERLYSKDKSGNFENSVGDIMNNVFGYLAAGIDWKASQTKGTKQLVEYAFEELRRMTGGIRQKEGEYSYFLSCIKSITEKLKNEEAKSVDASVEMHETIKHLVSFQDMLKNNPEEFFYAKDFTTWIYMMILNLWDYLGNYTYTFRLLACIARMQYWQDNAAGRIKLRDVLISSTCEWKRYE